MPTSGYLGFTSVLCSSLVYLMQPQKQQLCSKTVLILDGRECARHKHISVSFSGLWTQCNWNEASVLSSSFCFVSFLSCFRQWTSHRYQAVLSNKLNNSWPWSKLIKVSPIWLSLRLHTLLTMSTQTIDTESTSALAFAGSSWSQGALMLLLDSCN